MSRNIVTTKSKRKNNLQKNSSHQSTWSNFLLPVELVEVLDQPQLPHPGPLSLQLIPPLISGKDVNFTSAEDDRLMFFVALSLVYSACNTAGHSHSVLLVPTQDEAYKIGQWVTQLSPARCHEQPFEMRSIWLGFGQTLKSDEARLEQQEKNQKTSLPHTLVVCTPARLIRLWKRPGGKNRLKLTTVRFLVLFDLTTSEHIELSTLITPQQTLICKRGMKDMVKTKKKAQ